MVTGTYDHAHLETLQRVAVAIQQLWNQLIPNTCSTHIVHEMMNSEVFSSGSEQSA